MNRRNSLILAGVAAFVFFLVAGLPASVVLRWLAPDSARVSGLTGSVWNGSAAAAEIAGLRLGETQWRVSPATLLLGRLSGYLTTQIDDGTASGSIAVSLSGIISCADCSYEGSVAGLRSLVPALRLLDGRARIELASLEVRDKWPTRLVGVARVSGVPLGVPGAGRGPGAPTANFEASINADPVADDGVIEATIQDSGGPLEMTARLTIAKPGSYELAGRAKARPDAPPEMANSLNMLGPKGADGSTELAMSGSF